jgi:cation-transporting ATPase 13A2
MIFVAMFTVLFFIAFASTIKTLIDQGNPSDILAFKSLDLSTIAIPPQLPTTISVGVAFALARLKFKNIFCINPQRINIAGRIQTFVFDKTGTLTEDGLTIYGLVGTIGTLL